GDLVAWPANQAAPLASVVNYEPSGAAGLNIANGVIVPMCDEVAPSPCATGDIKFLAQVADTHLVVDVVGYFHAGSQQLTTLNTALGDQALAANTTGLQNTAFGAYTLTLNTTGKYDTAVGTGALAHNTAANNNTALGVKALFSANGGNA